MTMEKFIDSKEYEFHEIANLIDLLKNINKEEWEELKKDIKRNGLLVPITIFNDKILDGRNRYLACKELNIEMKFNYLPNNIDPIDFHESRNIHRRHLNSPRRTEYYVNRYEYEENKKAKERQLESLPKEGQKGFQKINVSTSEVPTLDNYQKIKEKGENGLKEKLRSKIQDNLKSEKKGKVIDIIAKKAGVGHETIRTFKKVKELNDPIITKKWEQAKQGKTTIKAVKMAIDKKVKPKFVPIIPKDKYDLIYADPPWEYNFTQSPTRSIEKEYPTMKLKDICKLEVPSAKDCVLFLWCTSPKLYPEGMEVIKAWGFTYKTSMVWVKDKIGMGYYARSRHEFLLIATKGKPGVPEPSDRFDSVIEQPRTKHSKKPEIVYEMIEKMYPDKKKIELFARNKREGWKSWGNEA